MAILYGTETGNSEEIAKELGDIAERLHFRTIVDEMNNFTLVCLPVIARGAAPKCQLPD
jgi:flavodoxin